MTANDFDNTSNNLYAPPQAPIADPVEQTTTPSFYVVSVPKFLFLFFATVGLYSYYWFWRHWKLHKIDKKLDLWPVPRAIFQIFFMHGLNREIDHLLERKQLSFSWFPNALATTFVIFSIISNILDRLAWRDIGSPYTDLLSLAALIPLAYCMVRSQSAANLACGDPAADANRHFTVTNYLWLGLGALFWVLILLGILLLDDPSSI